MQNPFLKKSMQSGRTWQGRGRVTRPSAPRVRVLAHARTRTHGHVRGRGARVAEEKVAARVVVGWVAVRVVAATVAARLVAARVEVGMAGGAVAEGLERALTFSILASGVIWPKREPKVDLPG